MASYACQYGCGQTFSTRSARDQHEENCSSNPANEEVTDE